MEQLILFVVTFVVVYLIYYFVTIRKEIIKEDVKNNPDKVRVKKKRKKKDYADGKIPVEVQYLLLKYRLDLNKISYKKLLYTIAWVSALDMSLAVTIVSFVPGMVYQLLVGFVVMVPLILISFKLIGNFYQKKGRKKDV